MSELAIEREYIGWEAAAIVSGLSVSSLRRLVDAGLLHRYRPMPGRGRTLLSLRELRQVIEASANEVVDG